MIFLVSFYWQCGTVVRVLDWRPGRYEVWSLLRHEACQAQNLHQSLNFSELEDFFASTMPDYDLRNFSDYEGLFPQPCVFTYCSTFGSKIPPFLGVASALGIVCNMVLLTALARWSLLRGQHRADQAKLILMAAMAILFAATLPFFTVEVSQGWVFGDTSCQVARALKFGSILTQGLLVAGSSWRTLSGRLNCLVLLTLLGLGLLCAVPAALSSSVGEVCMASQIGEMRPWFLTHILLCLAVFDILPGAMAVAILALKWQKDSLHFDRTWLFYLFWAPYGLVLIPDMLVREQLVSTTCQFQEDLNYFLGLLEGLGILHCWLYPLIILGLSVCCRRPIKEDTC
ncbi:atypical chemokine receptor 1-like isoform X1 [Varanus komodoensis]|uniref:atypical chemokine receptor 1-like isoform X1 n=1 Tax=Varanus komodoensis TaxID=61221 RepID=UPI001CF775DF|nr:atypical chemokine receptor 1-like isoform X1 [Varanus komodoensis]